jgi:hypothetical protein
LHERLQDRQDVIVRLDAHRLRLANRDIDVGRAAQLDAAKGIELARLAGLDAGAGEHEVVGAASGAAEHHSQAKPDQEPQQRRAIVHHGSITTA